jgi:alpha-L-fucosidase 2
MCVQNKFGMKFLSKICGFAVGAITLFALKPVSGATFDLVTSLDQYNVAWDVPGPTSSESMPIGNGDIGLNVWAETNGDLLFYIGKTDSWNQDVNGEQGLMKVGGVRVSLSPSSFANGAKFLQTLRLRTGEIEIKEGDSTLRVWVDANNPVIRVEANHAAPRSLAVSLLNWRPPNARDVTVPNQTNRIAWYHRNAGNANPHVANLTFGAVIKGDGLVRSNDSLLVSAKPAKSQTISIYPLTAAIATAEEWLAQLDRKISEVEKLKLEKTRADHQKWWDNFWHRSWVFVDGDGDAAKATQGYVLQRFVTACAGRGAFPIKFNGSIFVVENPGQQSNGRRANPMSPDQRTWGGQYWFQNTRAMYWPRLAAGDFDVMMPLFKMYAAQLAPNAAQVKGYYHHDGSYFAETAPFWGGLRYWGPEVKEDWTGHYFTPILELSMMMLDYYEYTGDKKFARETLLPVASAGLTFFDQHFTRDAQGKILLDPDNAIEMYWKVHNPAPDIAGLQAILGRIIALPDDLVSATERTNWQRMVKELPELPTGMNRGRKVLLPYTGPQTARIRNGENPELYAIYPFRLYGLGLPDLELGTDTFKARKMTQMGCWVQDPIQAAMLGLAEVAKKYTLFALTRKEPGLKFPAFWAKANDYAPDQDNGGNGENGLQQMLVQSVGQKILVAPAWPSGWNADFKLNAAFKTTVQGTIKNGKVSNLVVTPRSRQVDVIDMSAVKNPASVIASASPAKAAAISSEQLDESYNEPKRVACVGDSIVFGAGIENRNQNSWPAVLGRWLGDGWSVRNFGLNGATMLMKGDLPYRKQPIFNQALEFKPDVLIISLGGNDSKHPTDEIKDAPNNWQYAADYINDYKELIAAFRTQNPKIKIYVCVPLPAYPGRWGINDTTIREEIAPKVRQVAQETGSTAIDLYSAMSGKPELFPDTVHPNAGGARLVAAAVYRTVAGREPPAEQSVRTVIQSGDASMENILSPEDTIVPLKQTVQGKSSILAVSGEFGGEGDVELVGSIIDGNLETKYFNKAADPSAKFPGVNTGFLITPKAGAKTITAVQLATANDSEERDPINITIEGSNNGNPAAAPAGDFTLIYSGPSGLSGVFDRNHWGQVVTFTNAQAYKSYRVLVTSLRGEASATQYSEVKLGTATPH